MGERIKTYLKDNGISQTWLASKIGVSPQTLHAWLSAPRVIRAEDYVSICRILGVNLETFAD